MKVDHLAADVHGHSIRAFTRLKSEASIKRDHRGRVLHWQRNVIEPADAAGLLSPEPGACRNAADDCLHKCTT